MKIYFAASIKGGRELVEDYKQLISYLKKKGTVLTEHIADSNITDDGEKLEPIDIYSRDVKWIEEADLVIAEVSIPSLGVGYELAYAEKLNKKIICLFNKQLDKKLSAMILGNKNFVVRNYNSVDEAIKQLDILI
jgi:nucleoside 2-deoxyribosyltransferase